MILSKNQTGHDLEKYIIYFTADLRGSFDIIDCLKFTNKYPLCYYWIATPAVVESLNSPCFMGVMGIWLYGRRHDPTLATVTQSSLGVDGYRIEKEIVLKLFPVSD